MEDRIPKTKEECFALLDEKLSEEEKKIVMEEDEFKLHFGLGMWIRNKWLYPQSEKETEELMKTFTESCAYWDADDCSSIILKAYRKHLKRTLKK